MKGGPAADSDRHSWVASAAGSDFPIQSLPYGVFSAGDERPRVGVAIGSHVLDLAAVSQTGLLADACPDAPEIFGASSLNPFMARGRPIWRGIRGRLSDLLTEGHPDGERHRSAIEAAPVDRDSVTLHLPVQVGDYIDFYSSKNHAENLGRIFRPDGDPMLPNWRHLPVGYHGRAGTMVVSGTPIVRPCGQRRDASEAVCFGPSTKLDIELEVGFVVGVPSALGQPVPISEAPGHIFGCVLVNDWSARDIQAWEYQPLGPFLGKSFATSISGWVLPLEALTTARVSGPRQDPEPLPYLRTAEPWGFDLSLEVWLRPAGHEKASQISGPSFAGMYWSIAQQVAHATINGASLRTGDLLASGTVSGPTRHERGSLLELAWNGSDPLDVGGTPRAFLEDGDEVVLRGYASLPGPGSPRLALGEVRGRIDPNPLGSTGWNA